VEINFKDTREAADASEAHTLATPGSTPGPATLLESKGRRPDSCLPDQTFLFTFKSRYYIVINDKRRGII